MAQGGTIPTNRTQTVTFYNTTGIIEKEKGIYLSPSFKNKLAGKEVREIYLDVLNVTAVKDADYTDIPISSWSPEDRTLTVRGNIDDFRLVTEEGDCLNYLVITRNITKLVNNVSTIYKYYYGFFITGVAQAGGSSVKLTLEPDTFTNVFYLHNKHQLTALEVGTTDYEPFNERMKNCHVNRQHYNRVRVETSYTLQLEMNTVSADPHLEIGKSIVLDFTDQAGTQVEGIIIDFDDTQIGDGDLFIKISCEEQQEIGEPDNYSTFVYEGNNYSFDYTTQGITWNTIKKYLPDNLKIFLNQEESFKFKYQYRDKRYPFSLDEPFTDEEVQTIKTSNWASLTNELKKKIILASVQYLVIEMKSQEKIGMVNFKVDASEPIHNHIYFRNYYEGLFRQGPVVFVPLFNVPEIFKKYESEIIQFMFYIKMHNTSAECKATTASEAYFWLNFNSLSDFVFSSYVVNDILIPKDKITIDLVTKRVKLISNNGYNVLAVGNIVYENKSSDLFVLSINKNWENGDTNAGLTYKFTDISQQSFNLPYGIEIDSEAFSVFMLSGYTSRDINLSFPKEYPLIKNIFKEPILDAEPYTFYSISCLSYELPFNKNRYYETDNVEVTYYVSINGAIKISYIPSYTVEGIKTKYYNESLVFTLSDDLPLISDSYASYYYQNKAQMKNQFAVNDYNRATDLQQHLLVSGPNAVGYSAGKGGMQGGGAGAGFSALLETGNQFMQMVDETIDWKQSNKVLDMNQSAKLADMGARPDSVKQTGSDVFYDLATRDSHLFLNHYTIDTTSYNSIAKFLERFGYQINLYDTLHVNDRVGWNYIKLNSFDINPAFDIMVGQEQDLMRIFSNGVTLLHDKTYLTNGHNYEIILNE